MPDAAGRGETRPPRAAEAWLERRLPDEVADAIAGDLHAEYLNRADRGVSRLRNDAWYWGQVLTLRAGMLRRAADRLVATRPTHERARAARRKPDPWSRFPMQPRDFHYAVRRLIRSPGFTVVAVASLALGIGANTAMFSIVNAVLIRDLPIERPEEMVEVYTSDSDGFAQATSSHPDYVDLRTQTDVFQNVVGTRSMIARVDIDDRPEVTFAELISWDFFQTLGVPMAAGRAFLEEEDQTPGTHPVVILGYRFWESHFAGDESVIGSDVRVNGRPYTVVGVAPEAYSGSMPVLVAGFFAPLMMTNELDPGSSDQIQVRNSRSMFLKGRLQPGVSIEQANAALAAFSRSLEERYPETNENRVMSAVPSGDVALHPMVDRVLSPVAALLLAVVGIVLLIACANLASFLLARAEDRRREIAVRLALGAGRRRLVGQLLTETTILALLGGVAGLALAQWTVQLMMAFQPPIPIPVDLEISLDRTVLAFTAAVSLVAGFLFGLVPALQATNPDVAPTLKNEATGTGTKQKARMRNGLVVTQVAFSFVLLIGAGLFVRSLQKAQLIDPGFDTGPGALVWPMPELSGYETPDEVRAFFDEYEQRLLSEPGITGVAQADRLPLGVGVQTRGYVLPGVPSDTPDGDHDIDNASVNAAYHEAMGVDIVAGRAFSVDDEAGAPVAIVSQAFVDRYYPGEDVVGRSIENGAGSIQIVGVAADTKVRTLGEQPRPYVYELRSQAAFMGSIFVVKGTASGEELVATARRTLNAVAPDMVLFEEIKTMNEHLALLLFPPRMAALLLSVFGGLALLLAGIGIYGVVSYAVAKRTREVGIRMSLGASARDVVQMAVSGGMRLVAMGGAVGVVLAAAVTWSIAPYLFGISATDIATFVAIPLLLMSVALLAAWIPARRASRVDPVRALRSE